MKNKTSRQPAGPGRAFERWAKGKVRVTVWTCREWDQALVLEGTSGQTRACAEQNRATGSKAKLKSNITYMTRRALNALPEHGG